VFAGKFYQAARCALVMPLVALLLLTPPWLRAQTSAPPTQSAAAAAKLVTNQPAKNTPAPPSGTPLPAAAKRKAGFLAGAGLVILSLLALAAGLALVRTFKR
jgi:hypothetical protein